MQLGFSSNVTLDTVTLTNFVKDFNFCGRLCFDSLVAKPLSDLYDYLKVFFSKPLLVGKVRQPDTHILPTLLSSYSVQKGLSETGLRSYITLLVVEILLFKVDPSFL